MTKAKATRDLETAKEKLAHGIANYSGLSMQDQKKHQMLYRRIDLLEQIITQHNQLESIVAKYECERQTWL